MFFSYNYALISMESTFFSFLILAKEVWDKIIQHLSHRQEYCIDKNPANVFK